MSAIVQSPVSAGGPGGRGAAGSGCTGAALRKSVDAAAAAAAAAEAGCDDVYSNEYNQFMVCGSLFECPSKYAPIKPIGRGAYGIVCSARNLETNERIAIKKISGVFDSPVDAKRTLREVRLLSHLRHENVIGLRDMIPPPAGMASFKDVYLVYDLMDTDLHQIIRSPQPLSEDHISYFTYQVLRGLKYIHSAHILHRDLKPSNLLVNANCDLRICDFGLARVDNQGGAEGVGMLTEYVVTRWYRAPELLLSCPDYTAAIDVWSVGCILAELLGRKPLFPGKDYVHQLNLITKTIGSPCEDDIQFVSSEKARRYLRSLPRCPPTDFRGMWPDADPQALDLLSRMLMFDPSRRIGVDEALRHPYLSALHDAADEPVAGAPFTFEVPQDMTAEEGRELMWQQVLERHPELERCGGGGGGGSDSPRRRDQRAGAA
ncbi:MAG: mitogen-activated protein kinase 8 [Monoraphidium minutum]|nr:MAG: mitogen-activated protein kinase 8 [Monoraphidium minutum]